MTCAAARLHSFIVAQEIQLLACGYAATCSVRGCRVRATAIARYTDNQGRALHQRELCERHAAWLRAIARTSTT